LRPEPIVLAFDTSAAHCAAVVLSGGRVRASASEAMAKGQAERLLPMLETVLKDAGLAWSDIGLVACGTGPGNFTGIRVSVAMARGLALGLGITAIGVTMFEARAFGRTGPVRTAVRVPGGFLTADVVDGRPGPVAAVESIASAELSLLAGERPETLAEAIARTAAAGGGSSPPVPFYARPPDARPMAVP
jgi:hypothetical protein